MHFDETTSTIEGDGWSYPAKLSESDWGDLGAAVSVKRGLTVLLRSDLPESWISLWLGDPTDEVGVAIVKDRDGRPIGLSEIPLCTCGIRGCGNAGVQFATQVSEEVVPLVLNLIEGLPTVPTEPERGETWFHDDGRVLTFRDIRRGD